MPLYAAPILQQVAEPSQWVSVDARLPERFTEVLIAFAETVLPATGQYTGADMDKETDGWCYPSENKLDEWPTVTHWMPLPAAPQPKDMK